MHFEALTNKGTNIFRELHQFSEFYLAGGTSLALQIGHRVSVDFDLFTDEKIKRTLLPFVEKIFSPLPQRILVNNSRELTLSVDEVKLTFLHYPFPPLLPLLVTPQLPLLSVKEIAATKAYTIGRRGTLKDYVDIYTIIAGGYTHLPDIIELAARKYGEAFDPRLFLEQLAYFDDLEDAPIEFLGTAVTKKELEEFFATEIRAVPL